MTTCAHDMPPRFPEYVIRPLLSLVSYWLPKGVLSLTLALAWELIRHVLGLYDQLLATDPVLILMVVTMLVLDWVTGVARAVRDGERLRSQKFRRAGWKVIEYGAIITAMLMLANGAVDTPAESVFGLFDEAALFYIGSTEAFSVIENVTGSTEKAISIVQRVQDVLKGDWTPKDSE